MSKKRTLRANKLNLKKWNGKIKRGMYNKEECIMTSARLERLKQMFNDNIEEITQIAEANTPTNENGEVVIPLDDEWRDDDWDEFANKMQ